MVKKILQKVLMVLIGIVKSGIIAEIVVTVSAFLIYNLETAGFTLIPIIALLPAMFLYHLCRVLNFKSKTCDMIYFLGYIPVFAFCTYGSFVPNSDGGDQYCMIFGTVMFFDGIIVYVAEVIFREQKKITKALVGALIFAVLSAIVIPPAYFLAKHNIIKDQEEKKVYADKFIGSLVNGTDYYKQCIENSLVDVNHVNKFILMMTPNYKVTYGSYSGIGAEYNCRVEFNNGKVLWLEVVGYSEALQIWRIAEERTKEEQMKMLKNAINSLKVMQAVEANESVDINNAPLEMREYIKQRQIEKSSGNK